MKTRREVIDFCLSLGNTYEDYPFKDDNWTVMRHVAGKKTFALIYEYHGQIQVNVKCDPQWTAFWRGSFSGVIPGYHMNKVHWNTILLDGTVPDEDIKTMIADSYGLTLPTVKRRKNRDKETKNA